MRIIDTYKPTVAILTAANEFVKYPRIELRSGFTLTLAGGKAKHPGSVNITDGESYGNNKWYGRILRSGGLDMPTSAQPIHERLVCELDLFQLDPAKYAKGYSDAESTCMFCRKKLTDPQSVAVGYGGTCAAHYALPWGGLEALAAKKASQTEFDLTLPSPDLPDNMTQLQLDTTAAESPHQTNSIAIDHLKEVAYVMLSVNEQYYLAELIALNPDDEYMLLVTKLWEAL